MIKYNFVLYSNNIEGIKEYEKGIKLEEPTEEKSFEEQSAEVVTEILYGKLIT